MPWNRRVPEMPNFFSLEYAGTDRYGRADEKNIKKSNIYL